MPLSSMSNRPSGRTPHVKVGRQAGDGRLPERKPRLGIEAAELGQHEAQRFLVDAAEPTQAGVSRAGPPGRGVPAGFPSAIEPPAFAELDASGIRQDPARAIPGGSRPWTRRSAVSTIATSQPSASAISRVSSTRYPASLRLWMMYRRLPQTRVGGRKVELGFEMIREAQRAARNVASRSPGPRPRPSRRPFWMSPTMPCGWRAPRGGKMRRIMRSARRSGVDFRVERRGVGSILGVLQQRIALQLRLDESRELLMGQLQQLDGLQQLRRHRQRLPLPQLQPLR